MASQLGNTRHFLACRRCIWLAQQRRASSAAPFSTSSAAEASDRNDAGPSGREAKNESSKEEGKESSEPGPMSRRLEEATEDALLTGGRAGRRAVEDAGFSEELKEKLLDKISDAKFRKQYAGAFAEAGLPQSAGEGTRQHAAAEPWSGQESTSDAVLRMLDDARKPLGPGLRGSYQPPPVDMRLKRDPAKTRKPGQRIASARDKAAAYTSTMGVSSKDMQGLSAEEKEEMKKEFRERFQPGARGVMPNTISGLTALANERIEDAIARGQFKNIPRGRGVERDDRANNPFIDTTEYIMNKMIQRQDMVPPWIEKQQDIARSAHSFRTRLRNDWKRHAARMLAAQGGSLQEQMRRAERYAESERVHNPRRSSVEQISAPSSMTDDPVMVKMRQQVQAAREAKEEAETAAAAAAILSDEAEQVPLPPPFRDPVWEQTEHKYMQLSIDTLNATTRSYNLMAPDLAKKPYFSLQRELAACFADVAPQLAREIQQRATQPKVAPGGSPAHTPAFGFLEQLGGGSTPVRVHLEAPEKAYGLKEWWRDLWKKE